MRLNMRLFLALTLAALVALSCGGGQQEKVAGYRARSGPVSLPDKIPASLLPTLAVGLESCYVFLQPDGDSPFFGPLNGGELVKRVDAERLWTLIWIPRLRISGWVRKNQVYRVKSETSDEDTVPTENLTVLNILKTRVNIRKGPSTRTRVIFRARQRQEFVMLDEKKGWYQVWVPPLKQKGWVAGNIAVKQRKNK
ncbi:MAG: SH3 domain-containing protein [Deltaproteobacteria bacterium]|nr:SH3 domain-containing protein [Deltaproteobacteria bacterium]